MNTLRRIRSAKVENLKRQWKTLGYDDGYQGLPARYRVAEYQTAYRRGLDAAARGVATAAEAMERDG